MDYRLDSCGSIPGGARFFLFSTQHASSEAHPGSYPMGAGDDLPRGKNSWSTKPTTHFRPMPKSKMVELYLHSPICFHGHRFTFFSLSVTLNGVWAENQNQDFVNKQARVTLTFSA
jgi:hypothetical protein